MNVVATIGRFAVAASGSILVTLSYFSLVLGLGYLALVTKVPFVVTLILFLLFGLMGTALVWMFSIMYFSNRQVKSAPNG